MKILIIFFLLLPFYQWGQSYNLLPDSCTFCLHLTSWGTSSLHDTWYGIYPDNDTTLNGNTYVSFYQNDGVIGMRQEQNRLLGYHEPSGEEVLIMDFGHQPGDTIHNLYDLGMLYSARVESLDSFQLNDGSYHRWLTLTGIRHGALGMDTSNWEYSQWEIVWNERGLCHWLGGGLVYNAHEQTYIMSILYAYPTWCTTDPRYIVPNGNTCFNCVNPTRGDAGLKEGTSAFSVHPNPAQDRIYLQFQSPGQRQAQLYNFLGQVVRKQSSQNTTIELEVSELATGTYLLHVSDESGGISSTQLVVVH